MTRRERWVGSEDIYHRLTEELNRLRRCSIRTFLARLVSRRNRAWTFSTPSSHQTPWAVSAYRLRHRPEMIIKRVQIAINLRKKKNLNNKKIYVVPFWIDFFLWFYRRNKNSSFRKHIFLCRNPNCIKCDVTNFLNGLRRKKNFKKLKGKKRKKKKSKHFKTLKRGCCCCCSNFESLNIVGEK